MRKTIKRTFFLILFTASFISQFNLCLAATKEEIKAKMKKIDSQVTKIDREITAMKKQLNLLDDQINRMSYILKNPKIYPVNYKGTLRINLSEKQLQELATTWALQCLLWNVDGPECPSDPNKMSVKYFSNKLKAYSQREKENLRNILRYDMPEKIGKIKYDIEEQTKEKEKLTDEFLALDASLKGAVSERQVGITDNKFYTPKMGGVRVDGCLYWARQCGQPAANEFCKRKGYSKSTPGWSVDHHVPKTKVLGDGKICETGKNHPNCGAFSFIECE